MDFLIMNTRAMRIVHASATADAGDPPYVQKIQCGRHALLADEPAVRGGMDAGVNVDLWREQDVNRIERKTILTEITA
jgi:hypothetical protein